MKLRESVGMALTLVAIAGCAPSVLGLPGRDALVRYVDRAEGVITGTQHFCVVPYGRAERERYTWVYWRERHRLVLWEGADPAHAADALIRSRRVLDLDKDVVATEAAIAGSTYLVTRAWVEDTLRDCEAFGFRYAVATGR